MPDALRKLYYPAIVLLLRSFIVLREVNGNAICTKDKNSETEFVMGFCVFLRFAFLLKFRFIFSIKTTINFTQKKYKKSLVFLKKYLKFYEKNDIIFNKYKLFYFGWFCCIGV